MNSRQALAAVAGVGLLTLGGAYLRYRQHAAPHAVTRVSAPQAAPALRGEIDITGRIQPRHVVYVNAPFAGRVAEMPVEVGESVSQGQMLVRIQGTGVDVAGAAAAADLEQAQSRVDDLSHQLADQRLAASTASAAATDAHDLAVKLRAAFDHLAFLYSQGATPKLKLEAAQHAYDQAHKDDQALTAVAQRARDRLDQLARDLDSASKLLSVKTNDAEAASEQASAGMLLAPVSGVITALGARAGDEVSPANGNLIEIATDLTDLQATFPVTPALAAKLKPGTPVELEIAEAGGAPVDGIIGAVKDGQASVRFVSPSPAVRPGSSALVRLRPP